MKPESIKNFEAEMKAISVEVREFALCLNHANSEDEIDKHAMAKEANRLASNILAVTRDLIG